MAKGNKTAKAEPGPSSGKNIEKTKPGSRKTASAKNSARESGADQTIDQPAATASSGRKAKAESPPAKDASPAAAEARPVEHGVAVGTVEEATTEFAPKPAPPPAGQSAVAAPPKAAQASAKGAEPRKEGTAASAAPETPAVGAPEEPKAQPEAIGPNILDGFELPAIYGKAGVFGGPKDRSAKPEDKLALPTGLHFQYERCRSLNANSFYCAMRWDYRQQHKSSEEGKRWWANKKLLVANPANGKAVVVRAVDYGPHESSGFAIAVSPGAAEALGLGRGDEVLISFADPKAPMGPAN
jgi:hypothetical protein